MAVYHGFFDAAIDELTGEYDRVYGAEDFTQYFERIVGTGVCVYENPDSLKAYYDSSSQRVLVNPGYAFIRGYWMKNDALFGIDMQDAATGEYVILAKLSLSRRLCEIVLESKSPEESYIDELVLAYVTVGEDSAVTVTDSRGETYCPTIDALGSISEKVKWAINYIENELEARLDEILSGLEEKSAEIDSKVEEANALIAKIAPPAVGTIKFSASQDVGEEWLRCDGSFINESQYPELVAALGKLTPSTTEWDVLSKEEMGTDITNGVTYNGKVWVYSWAEKKLYGVDMHGEEPIKEIPVTSEEAEFDNMVSPYNVPTALSIVGDTLFLVQFRGSGVVSNNPTQITFLCAKNFTEYEETITLSKVFSSAYANFGSDIEIYTGSNGCIPYILEKQEDAANIYYVSVGFELAITGPDQDGSRITIYYWNWDDNAAKPISNSLVISTVNNSSSVETAYQKKAATMALNKFAFNPKNDGELLCVNYSMAGGVPSASGTFQITSLPSGAYTSSEIVIEEKEGTKGLYTRDNGQTQCRSTAVISDSSVLYDSYWDPEEKKIHLYVVSRVDMTGHEIIPAVNLPSYTMVLPDCTVYLRNKAIWLVFLGSGFLFSRDIQDPDSFGFLDTSQELGILTQYGQCWYDETTSKVYILGQSSDSKVTLATLQLPTLFNYANDGAWLPMIASDGVPAYIKALGEPPPPEPPEPVIIPDFQVTSSQTSGLPSLTSVFSVTLDGAAPATQINFEVPSGQVPVIMTALQDYTNQTESGLEFSISVAGYGSDGFAKYSEVVIVGKVLQKGEKITAGESVTGYYDFSTVATYPDVVSVRITYTTKAAQ